jgi:hypothetical protein
MRLDERTHEHAVSGQVYSYDGNYEVGPNEIRWTVDVRLGNETKSIPLQGSIPVTSPGLNAVAEQAVHDAVVKRIDAIETAA